MDDLTKPVGPQSVTSKKIPASTDNLANPDGEPHFFTKKQLTFLQSYAESLDIEKALSESGMRLQDVKKSDYLTNEIQYIEKAACLTHRNSAAKGNHLRLMQKFEDDYDGVKKQSDKNSLANTLARMSEANLRVAGEYSDQLDAAAVSGIQVVINMDKPVDYGQEAPADAG